jgi:hypothetical protein
VSAAIHIADAVARLRGDSGPCLGAVFMTYTFDARFFEETILAALLPIESDPDEAPAAFLDEGRRCLQRVPVIVVADPGMLRGGQRFPYDLIRAGAERTFHSKLALCLFANAARLCVGSGNLTPGGYGGNAELSAALSLDYQRDAALLARVLEFVERCGARGEAWTRLLAELRARLPVGEATASSGPALLDSLTDGPLLEAFLRRLPPSARIDRIGVLAPFHQEDGAAPESAVLDRLVQATEGRRSREFVLDVGLSWEGNAVAPVRSPIPQFDSHEGELWGWLEGDAGRETASWVVVGAATGRVRAIDDGRAAAERGVRDLERARAAGRTWPAGPIEARGPTRLIDRVAARVDTRLWLHPEVQRSEGRVYRQPLHGKLIAITVAERRRRTTHLLVGSPNATAAALLHPHGNVECALHLVAPGALNLGHLCPALVPVPRTQVELAGSAFVAPPPSPARWVEDAVFDAARGELRVLWARNAREVLLTYPRPDAPVQLLRGRPAAETRFEGFTLHRACCELEIRALETGGTARVPLRVENVVALPVEGLPAELNLEELVLLYAGRYSASGLAARRQAAGDAVTDGTGAESLFGDSLSPREIFRALLALGADLGDQSTSLSAFHVAIDGPFGVRRLADRILDAPETGRLTRSEAWIYGQELVRLLRSTPFDRDPVGPQKKAVLQALVQDVRARLVELAPSRWSDLLQPFYEVDADAP